VTWTQGKNASLTPLLNTLLKVLASAKSQENELKGIPNRNGKEKTVFIVDKIACVEIPKHLQKKQKLPRTSE
jgi:hypothetical protein